MPAKVRRVAAFTKIFLH